VVGKYDEQFLKLFCHTMQQLKQVIYLYIYFFFEGGKVDFFSHVFRFI